MKKLEPWVHQFIYFITGADVVLDLNAVYIDDDGLPHDKLYGAVVQGTRGGAAFVNGESYGIYDLELKMTDSSKLLRSDDVQEINTDTARLLGNILNILMPDIHEFMPWELNKIFAFLSPDLQGELVAGSAYDTCVRDRIIDEFTEVVFGMTHPLNRDSDEYKQKFKAELDSFVSGHPNNIIKVAKKRKLAEEKKRKLAEEKKSKYNSDRHIYLYAKLHYH